MPLVPLPRRPAPSRRACGDDLLWGRWVPAMWQALSDPDGTYLWAAPSDAVRVSADEDRCARYTTVVRQKLGTT